MSRKLSVCLSFDPDAASIWVTTYKSKNPSVLSQGDFDVVHAIPRILDLLKRKKIKATFFVPGQVLYAYPDAFKVVRDEGHEIGHHGMFHENPAPLAEKEEKKILDMGLEALDRVLGVRPRGYRSPAWDMSENTIRLLRDAGFLYDSSCLGNDHDAYYLRIGDNWTANDLYRFGEVSDFVELPGTWTLDDWIVFQTVWGSQVGVERPREIEELWREEFEYIYNYHPGGIATLTMHPQVIARGSRILMLERLIDHLQSLDGVVFETMTTVADRWKKENPLEQWKAKNPLLTGVNAITSLKR